MGYTYNPARTAALEVARAEKHRARQALIAQQELNEERRRLAVLERAEAAALRESVRYADAEKARLQASVQYGDTPAKGARRLAEAHADATGYSVRRRAKETP